MELAYDDRQRLERLEKRTTSLEARLALVEAQVRPWVPEPPPVIRTQAAPPRWTSPRPEPPIEPARERSGAVEPKPTTLSSDLEIAIGSRGLLWVGGLVTVLGLAFLVGLAINRGLISPTAQFIGELVLCLAFVGVGLWKRPQRIEFGDLLIGLGSCGAYLSVAAGHLDKHLYSSEVLVGLFVGLSAINVLYGAWCGAQAFVWIGLLGGLLASWMPLQRPGGLPLSVSLYLLALVPVLIVGARRKWPYCVAGAWVLGIPFSGAIEFRDGPWEWRVAGVTLGALALLMSLIGSTKTTDQSEDEASPSMNLLSAFGWIAIPGSAAVVGYFAPGLWMSAIVAAFAAVGVAVGTEARRRGFGESVIQASVATAFVFVPFGWTHFETSAIFIGLSLISAVVVAQWRPREGAILSVGGLGFAVYAYLWAATRGLSHAGEIGLVIGLMLALGGAIWIGSRAKAKLSWLVFGALIGAPMAMRLTVLFLEDPGVLTVLSASAFGGAVYTALLVGSAVVRRSKGVWASAWIVFLVAFFALLVDMMGGPPMPVGFAVPMLLLFLTSAGLLAMSARDLGLVGGEEAVQGLGAFFFGALWLRLAVVVLPIQGQCAIAWGALTFAVGIAILAGRLRLRSLLVNGYLAFGVAGFAYTGIRTIPWGHDVGLVAFGIVALVALTLAGIRENSEREAVLHVAAVAGWVVVTRFIWVLLTGSNLEVSGEGSMTIGMTVYALALIALGFGFREKILRYWSLGIFACAAVKVVLVDLAGLDAALRVLVLMGLGVAMIGGAYAYIRFERRVLASNDS